jgi:N-acylneuraminate cytidylyltransferase
VNVVGFIFARGGSKGIPRKNLRLLAGKPLVAHAIQTALRSRHIGRVVVSTEDEEIAAVARQYGAETPFLRPAELATDSAPEWLAWQHAIRAVSAASGGERIDVFVSVPATCPLRWAEDVDACVELLLRGNADAVVTVTDAHRSPYFNMVVLDADQSARLVIPPQNAIARRQDAPRVYDLTTAAYAARPDYVLTAGGIFQGNVKAVVIPPERAVDIDTELDFAFVEFLLQQPGRSAAAGPSGEL